MLIRKLGLHEPLPMDLLLLADPSAELVQNYIKRGYCFVGTMEGTIEAAIEGTVDENVLAVYVLLPTRPATIELVNVAVDERFQSKGLGKQMVQHAIEQAKQLGCHTLEVGTGNSGIGQLALYQKCGFRIVGVDLDFFVRHYDEEIYENGIPCRDMIRMSMDL